MNLLLDTSAYSALMRGEQAVLDVMMRAESVALPSIAIGELLSGFRAGNRQAWNLAQLNHFLSKPSVRVLNVTRETALRYAEVVFYLRKKGKPIPINDIWIASVAIEHGLQLVAIDGHFREIPLLIIHP